jgi:hemolysin D
VSRNAIEHGQSVAEDQDKRKSAVDRNPEGGEGSDSSYVARVSLSEDRIDTEQGRLPLEPGMTVTAEIKTGQRPIISYLLSPILRHKQESFRER